MHRNLSNQLEKWKLSNNRKPLILLGARQVGKTHLIKEFGAKHFAKMHHFNFETDSQFKSIFSKNLKPERIIQDLSLLINLNINIQTDLVFFDEIQNIPEALTSLKHFREQIPNFAICAAGSLLGLHLNEGSFPVGSVDFLRLYPLSFYEFLRSGASSQLINIFDEFILHQGEISEIAHEKLMYHWLEYLIVGGLPEVVVEYHKYKPGSFEAFENARLCQLKLITSYLADVAKHSGKINSMHIERVWRGVSNQLAVVQDQSTSRFTFKDVVPGIKNYSRLAGAIDWLEKAGLIIKIPVCEKAMTPISAYCKENHFKFFMFDVGILGAMLSMPYSVLLNQDYGTYKGYYAENFVAEELKGTGGEKPLFAWAEKTAEIEFLLQGNSGPIPIEVKSGKRIRSQSMRVFLERYKPKTSIIVSGKEYSKVKNAKDFQNNKIGLPLYLASQIWECV